jgi:prepilin-type N-terminal cleavage/methylation domain-containing protein
MECPRLAVPTSGFGFLFLFGDRMGPAFAVSAVQRRSHLWGGNRDTHGQSKNLDVYFVWKWKRSVALKHYMNVGAKIREIQTGKMSRGFSLIELMIAMTVLVVGLLGGIVVIILSSANNGKSKLHTTAATMAESTMEKIVAIPQNAVGTAAQTQITDCAGNTFTIETAQNVAGAGPALITNGAFAGSVDYSQPPVPNYSMQYVMCSTGATGMTYDIRWRIDAGPTPSTQLVTVSAKPGVGNQAVAAQFTLPSTLHQLRGNF